MLFVKVLITGHRKGSRLGTATERLDRRMNSLIEAYQGIFAGTRIATAGFAIETAGVPVVNLIRLAGSGESGDAAV
jgi:hypothetical protein